MLMHILPALLLWTQAATAEPTYVRPNGEDIYCAAISVRLVEVAQSNSASSEDDKTGLYALMLYFVGRVEGSMPTGGTAEAVMDMAQILDTTPPTEDAIWTCAEFMRDQTDVLVDQARRRHRSLH